MLLVGLILLVSVTIAMLSYIARWAVENVLETQGYQVSIASLDIGLIDNRLTINKVKGRDPAGNSFLLQRAFVKIHWRDLFDKQVQIDELKLRGLKLEVKSAKSHNSSNSSLQTIVSNRDKPGGKQAPVWTIKVGNVAVDNAQFCYTPAADQYCLNVARVAWQGKLAYQTLTPVKITQLPIRMQGDLQIDKLRITHRQAAIDLLALDKLVLNQVDLSGLELIRARLLQFEQVRMLQALPVKNEPQSQQTAFWTIRKLVVERSQIRNLHEIEIGKLHLSGRGADIVRQENGKWKIVERLGKLLPAPKKVTDKVSGDAQTPSVNNKFYYKISDVSLQLKDTWTFTDYTYKTPFKLKGRNLAIQLQQLNNRNVEKASPVTLTAELQKYARLELTGTVSPFKSKPTFDIKGNISSIDLRPLTSQLERYLGYRVKSGQMDGAVELKSMDGVLQGNAELDFQQLALVEVREQTAEELEQQLGVPLNSALSLLREKDNSIHLKVPVTGDIGDPQFSINDAVMQVVTKAVNETVKSYYTDYGLSLAGYGQYSLVVKGASKLFGFLNKLRFNDVIFATGATRLTAEQKTYLDTLAKMLASRPQVHLTLCGFVTQADLLKQEPWLADEPADKQNLATLSRKRADKLLALADERAENIKDYLVKRWSIVPKRLIVCEAEYDLKKDALPRVAISI